MKKIVMALIAIGTLANADLVWQDNSDAKTTQRTWQEAIDYCEALSLDGHDDWRLSNINELKSIVDQTKMNPAIVDGFVNTVSSFYWSSTTVLGNEYFVWGVGFFSGDGSWDAKSNSNYVRCVRAGE